MLIERARRGLTVVRLKGGDPFIFGRGGEEAEALADAGIPFEVVPGVTTPLGIAAYTGVPLTHREHTSAVTFVTGHAVEAIDWDKVGHAETLVIFMGLTHLRRDRARADRHAAAPPETPAMAVRWATRPDQETLTGTLATLPALIASADEAAGHHRRRRSGAAAREADWYERLPLFGKRIVVTRAREQADALSAQLRALGADVIELPTIEIRPAADYGAARSRHRRSRLLRLADLHQRQRRALFPGSPGPLAGGSARAAGAICAIGPATRAAVEALHLKVDLMGKEYVAEGLLEAFAAHDLEGKRILLPRAAVARDLVPAELRRRGAQVDVVEAYRTVVPPEAAGEREGDLRRGAQAGLGHLHQFLHGAEPGQDNRPEDLAGVKIASIGPVTSATARQAGLDVTVEASEYTVDGLVKARSADSSLSR